MVEEVGSPVESPVESKAEVEAEVEACSVGEGSPHWDTLRRSVVTKKTDPEDETPYEPAISVVVTKVCLLLLNVERSVTFGI